MSLTLRPLSNRVAIDPDDPEDMSAGNIYIPTTAQQQPQTGTIVAVGPGKVSEFPVVTASSKQGLDQHIVETIPEFPRKPMSLEVGMRVVFGKYAGSEVEIDRQTYIICRETDVMSVIYEESDESD